MKAPEQYAAQVRDTLSALLAAALEACDATDTEEARKRLNAVWFAVHEAQEAINTAERETRRVALATLGQAA
jgi:hypothetical protein